MLPFLDPSLIASSIQALEDGDRFLAELATDDQMAWEQAATACISGLFLLGQRVAPALWEDLYALFSECCARATPTAQHSATYIAMTVYCSIAQQKDQ